MKTSKRLMTASLSCALITLGSIGCDRGSQTPTADATGAASDQQTPGGATTDNAAASTPTGAPPIAITPGPVRNFGIVEPNSTLSAEFELSNPLDTPLKIITAQPTCTCTSVDMDGVIIPAGGSVAMPLTMTTNRAVGRKSAMVKVLIEGYSQPLVLRLDAENAWAVRSIPPHLSIREKADQPEQLTGSFVLESTDQRPFRVLHVMDEAPSFIGFDPEKDTPRARYTLRYDFTGLSCEELPKFLLVHTDHPKARMIDVRVRHDPCTRIQKAIPMKDFRSNLGELAPGSSIEFEVSFKNPRIPRIASATCPDSRFRVTMLEQVSDGKDLMVSSRVEVDPDMPEGLFQIPIIFSDGQTKADHLLYGWITKK